MSKYVDLKNKHKNNVKTNSASTGSAIVHQLKQLHNAAYNRMTSSRHLLLSPPTSVWLASLSPEASKQIKQTVNMNFYGPLPYILYCTALNRFIFLKYQFSCMGWEFSGWFYHKRRDHFLIKTPRQTIPAENRTPVACVSGGYSVKELSNQLCIGSLRKCKKLLRFHVFADFFQYSRRIFGNDNFRNIFKTTKKTINNDKTNNFRAHCRNGT